MTLKVRLTIGKGKVLKIKQGKYSKDKRITIIHKLLCSKRTKRKEERFTTRNYKVSQLNFINESFR